MKLYEATKDTLQDLRKAHLSNMETIPNDYVWVHLALEVMSNIISTNAGSCWFYKNKRAKVIEYTRQVGGARFMFRMSLRRFMLYMIDQEIDKTVLGTQYELSRATPKKFVHSTCGEPTCIRPDHLCESYTSYDPNKKHNTLKGESSPVSKLTEYQATQIYLSPTKAKELAEEYSVTTATIYNIKNKRAWKHIHNTYPQGDA